MSRTASPAIPFIYYREYFRVKATAYITEEGMFKEKPDNITTPLLEVDIVYRVCVSTEGGELQIVDFDNPPMMDKGKKTGGPVTLDGEEWFTEPGDGETAMACVTVFSTRLPDNVKGAAKFMYAIAAEKEEIKPPIPA